MTTTQTVCSGLDDGRSTVVAPDLGDLIPELLARGVDILIIPTPQRTERCRDGAAAVAYVAHRAPSEALPDGFVHRTPACTQHLAGSVTWELRRGSPCWIEIFHNFPAVAS